MEVTVQLGPEDVETYAAFVRSRDRIRRVLFPVLLFPLLIGALSLRVARSHANLRLLSGLLPALLAIAAMGLALLVLWQLRQVREARAQRASQACVPVTLSFSASGISGRGGRLFATTWAQVRGFADTGEHIIIMLGNVLEGGRGQLALPGVAPGYIVPKRCFRDDAQRAALLAELGRYSRPLAAALTAKDLRLVGYFVLLGAVLVFMWARWLNRH